MENNKDDITRLAADSESPPVLEYTPRKFLTELWGESPPGVANVYVMPPKHSGESGNKSLWFNTFRQVDLVLDGRESKEVYTGVALAHFNRPSFRKGGRVAGDEAVAITGLWADIDVEHEAHQKPNLPPTEEDAKRVMAQLPFEPSLIVDSGHGFQYWWLLPAPWVFADDAERQEARRLSKWWQDKIRSLFQIEGWDVDSVPDLSRILRLPGSFNNKLPGDRKEVKVVHSSGHRITLEGIRKAASEDCGASPAKTTKGGSATRQGRKKDVKPRLAASVSLDLEIKADAQPDKERLDALLKANEKFRNTWERNRSDLKDQSASGYDLSLAIQMAAAGWRDQEMVNALIFWRASRDESPKLRLDYYQKTISKARQTVMKGSGRMGDREQVIVSKDEWENLENCLAAISKVNDPVTMVSTFDAKEIGVVSNHEDAKRIEVFDVRRTRVEVLSRVQFLRITDEDTRPTTVPPNLVSDIHVALRKHLHPLRGIKRLPTLWNGRLVTDSGYHPESGYFYDLPEGIELRLPVAEALAIIDEFFGQFPFSTPADRANALSILLGAPLKPLGNAPGLLVDKPASQTGASLLCSCIALVIDGRQPPKVTEGKSPGELEKWMMAKLKYIPGAIIFDNLIRALSSEQIASGMTDEYFGGRLLGVNEEVLLLTRSLSLFFTGTNFLASRELMNRCLRCRIDANHPAPERRTGFRKHLPDDVKENRTILVSAVSSIAQRWVEKGMPQGTPFLGAFIRYTQALSGLMSFAEIPDLDANRSKSVAEMDPSESVFTNFIQEWWEDQAGAAMKAGELLVCAGGLPLVGEDDRSLATSLTGKLRENVGRVFDLGDGVNVKLQDFGRDANGRAKRGISYKLVQVEANKP